MYGDNVCLGGDYFMFFFLDNWEWNVEKSMIVWVEWMRYFYVMVMNDDMCQQVRELVCYEVSMVWGFEFLNCFFIFLCYYEGYDEQIIYGYF